MPKAKKKVIGYHRFLRKTTAANIKTKLAAKKKEIEGYCKLLNISKKIDELGFDLSNTPKKEKSLYNLVSNLTENDVFIVCQDSDLSDDYDELVDILNDIKERKLFLYIIERGNNPSISNGVIDSSLDSLFKKDEKVEENIPLVDEAHKRDLFKKFLQEIYGSVNITKPIAEKKEKK